jgi:hypothetical protein
VTIAEINVDVSVVEFVTPLIMDCAAWASALLAEVLETVVDIKNSSDEGDATGAVAGSRVMAGPSKNAYQERNAW